MKRARAAPTLKSSIEAAALIRAEIRRSADARYDHRLHGVLLVLQGRPCHEVAAMLDETPRTVQRWAQRFRQQGLAGLHDGPRSGRPALIAPIDRARIRDELSRSPRAFDLAAEQWDPSTVRAHLHARYGVDYSVRHCRRLLAIIGPDRDERPL